MRKRISTLFLGIAISSTIIAETTSICPFSGKNDKTFEIFCRVGETILFKAPGQILTFKIDNAKNWLSTQKDNLLWIQPRFSGLTERLHIFSSYNGKTMLFSFKLIEGDPRGVVADTIEIKVVDREYEKSYN